MRAPVFPSLDDIYCMLERKETRKEENKAVYTAESVACDWAGAVMRKLPKKRRKTNALPTNQRTDGVTYRVACTRLKR